MKKIFIVLLLLLHLDLNASQEQCEFKTSNYEQDIQKAFLAFTSNSCTEGTIVIDTTILSTSSPTVLNGNGETITIRQNVFNRITTNLVLSNFQTVSLNDLKVDNITFTSVSTATVDNCQPRTVNMMTDCDEINVRNSNFLPIGTVGYSINLASLGSLNVYNCSFIENYEPRSGVINSGKITNVVVVDTCRFHQIFYAIVTTSIVRVTNSYFSSIQAPAISGISLDFRGCSFVSTPSTINNYFITSLYGDTTMRDCYFYNVSNRLDIVAAGTIDMDNCTFISCKTDPGFNIVSASQLPSSISNSFFINNSLSQAVYFTSSELSFPYVNNTVFDGNARAINSRGDLYISKSIFRRNKLLSSSGQLSGAVVANSRFIIVDSLFDSNSNTGAFCQGKCFIQNSRFYNNSGSAILGFTIEVDGCVFESNSANDRGGAISIVDLTSSKPLNVSNCVFRNNRSPVGGAIYSPTQINLNSIEFIGNVATLGGGIFSKKIWATNVLFQDNFASSGGGIYMQSFTLLSFSQIKAINNSATYGGVIYLEATSTPTNISISSSSFESNSANSGSGGAIYIGDSVNFFNISDCTFKFNYALLDGGSIFLNPAGISLSMKMVRVQTDSNYAGNSGGFLYIGSSLSMLQFDGIESKGDSALINGGSVSILSAKSASIWVSNTRNVGCTSSSIGGAWYIAGVLNSLNFINTTWLNNTCETYSGGALAIGLTANSMVFRDSRLENNFAAYQGGAFSMQSASKIDNVMIYNVIATNNSAPYGSAFSFSGTSSSLNLDNALISSNSGFEGGLFLDGETKDAKISNCTFEKNKATFRGAAISSSVNSNNFSISSSLFSQNIASSDGSAISIRGYLESFVIQDSVLERNQGGGIQIDQQMAKSSLIQNCEFNDNSATSNGAAIFVTSEQQPRGAISGVYVFNSTFGGNTASNGGAFSFVGVEKFTNPLPKIDYCRFVGNRATNGGALYLQSPSVDITETNQIVDNCEFHSNVAINGGAILVNLNAISQEIIVSSRSVFSQNSASSGGSIVVQSPQSNKRQTSAIARITNSQFDLNSASRYGGAVQSFGGLSIDNSSFKSNMAITNGGGMSVENGTLYLENNSIEGTNQIYLGEGSSLQSSSDVSSLISCGAGRATNQTENSYQCQSVAGGTDGLLVQVNPVDSKLIIGIAVGVGLLVVILVVVAILFFIFYKRVSEKGDANIGMRMMMKNMMLEGVEVGSIIGKGYFGQVYSGTWNELPVAIKTLVDEEDEASSKKWKEEIKLLRKLNHPNIVRLFGLCHVENKLSMVLEYAQNGAVDSYLRRPENSDSLSNYDLIIMAYEVAQGMSYLSKKGVLHRDLAARNLLLDGSRHVKISDFGMSKEDSFYEAKTKVLPYRWCAPEVIAEGTTTTASDVWSFAVCVWEIFSLGSVPYGMQTNEEVVLAVQRGERLPRPSRCPEFMFAILLHCWNKDPNQRPDFASICLTMMDHYANILKLVVHDMDEQFDTGTYFMGSEANA